MRANLGILADSLGWALLHSIWQVTVIAALVFVALAIVPRHRPQMRHIVAFGGLIGSFIALIVTWNLSYRMLAGTDPAGLTGATAEGWQAVVAALGETTGAISLLWALGFSWLGVRYVRALRATVQLRREGVSGAPSDWEERFRLWIERLGGPNAAELLQSSRIKTPVAIGIFKPVVLVPAGFFLRLPTEQAEAVLIHEIAHICRQDYLFGLVQAMICNVFFFHPAIRYLSRQIDIEREYACDAWAVRETRNSSALAQGLSKVALESRDMVPAFAMAANGARSPIVQRIARLRERPFREEGANGGPAAMLSIAFAGCLTIAVTADATLSDGRETEAELRSARAASEVDANGGWSEDPATPAAAASAAAPSETTTAPRASRQSQTRQAERQWSERETRSTRDRRHKTARRTTTERSRYAVATVSSPQFSFTKSANRMIRDVAWQYDTSAAHSAGFMPAVATRFAVATEAETETCSEERTSASRPRTERIAARAAGRERHADTAMFQLAGGLTEREQERIEAEVEREVERELERTERELEQQERQVERQMRDLERRLRDMRRELERNQVEREAEHAARMAELEAAMAELDRAMTELDRQMIALDREFDTMDIEIEQRIQQLRFERQAPAIQTQAPRVTLSVAFRTLEQIAPQG